MLAEGAALDVQGILDVIDQSLHPKQRYFVHDKARRIAACVGARAGKSTGGRARFLRTMLSIKRARCLFIAPKQHQSKKILWEPFKEMLHRLGIPYEANESELVIKILHNGSTLMLGGAATKADIDRYRGLAFHEIGIDECSSFRPKLLSLLVDRVLAPRLGDYRGTLWLVSTPGHILRGLFYEVTRPGSTTGTPFVENDNSEVAGYSTHRWSLEDGAPYAKALKNAWAEAQDTKRRNEWSDDHPVWKREYLGLWSADDTENIFKYRPHDEDGNELNQWDPNKDAMGFAILPEHIRNHTILYAYGVDPGIRDPFGLTIFAWSPHDPKKMLYHVYEFSSQGMYSDKVAKLFLGPKKDAGNPKGLIGHTNWPAVMVADIQNNLALFDQLSNVNGLNFTKAEKRDKHSSYENFNGDLLEGRIKIMKGSELELQLMTLQFITDELGGISEDTAARNDLADSALYARNEASHLHGTEAPGKQPYFKPIQEDENGERLEPDDSALFFSDDYYNEAL